MLVLLLAAGGPGPQPPALPAPPAVAGPAAPTVNAPDAPAPGSKPPEHKPAAHLAQPDKKASPRAAERVSPPTPTVAALHQELRASGSVEDHSLASERARLEQLAAEIGKAREALKQETSRLEAMLSSGGEARAPGGEAGGASGVPPGSGLSPDAMREQVSSVSKAMKG